MQKNNKTEDSFKIDFAGIGAKKAATSWLARCLSEHPEIYLPPSKELHFFSLDKKYEKGLNFYKSYFKGCAENQIKGEFSTSYLSNKEAPERLKKCYPNVKIIVILRDLTYRAFSHFKHLMSKGKISKDAKITEAADRFPNIIADGMYSKYLRKWLREFSTDKILILFFDDIKENPKKVLEKTFNFLDVDKNFIPGSLIKSYNTSSSRLSPLFKPINKIYLKLRKSRIGRIIIKIGQKIGISNLLNLFLNITKKELKISQREKTYLSEFYKDEIIELENLLSVNLNKWKQL